MMPNKSNLHDEIEENIELSHHNPSFLQKSSKLIPSKSLAQLKNGLPREIDLTVSSLQQSQIKKEDIKELQIDDEETIAVSMEDGDLLESQKKEDQENMKKLLDLFH